MLLSLVPMVAVDRNAKAAAERDLEAARANLELAEARERRAAAMLDAGSGSQRGVDEARAQQHITRAEVQAAEARLRTVTAGPLDADTSLSIRSPVEGVLRAVRVALGQAVPQGTPLVDVAGTGRWVRVSLSASDAHAALSDAARARRIGSTEDVPLAPVLAPPSADPLRASIDRFFVLPPAADWTPGERVLVDVLVGSTASALAVPSTAVVRDAEGGAWVYERTSPESYRRRRVEPMRRDGARLLLLRGPTPGTEIVSTGAMELWGHELGADR